MPGRGAGCYLLQKFLTGYGTYAALFNEYWLLFIRVFSGRGLNAIILFSTQLKNDEHTFVIRTRKT